MITVVLFAALSIPPIQPQQSDVNSHVKTPIVPELVLAWLSEGLRQEEIREEVRSRGLTEYAESRS